MGESALAGVRVLDLCRVVSGPFATMQLGDLGADVVKVEEPGRGDESRRYGPPFIGGESAYFLSVNRNKRGCAIDLKSEAGRDLALRLAARADIVVENFRPGALERLGLGYDALSHDNPGLILVSISGFGRTGPDAARPGYDLIVQGESGVMDITGEADGPPMKVGTSIADLVSGLYAAQAALAGLARRDRTGRGGRIDVSMLDAMASLLTFNAGMYFATGETPRRRGNAHPTIAPYETFEAADGWVNVGVANDKFWSLFCAVLGRPDIEGDPRFAPRRGPGGPPRRVEGAARAPDPRRAAPSLGREARRRRRALRRDQDGRRGVRGRAARESRAGADDGASGGGRRPLRRRPDPVRRRAAARCDAAPPARRAHGRGSLRMARPRRGSPARPRRGRRLRADGGGGRVNDLHRLGETMLARACADERQQFGSFFLLRLLGMSVDCGEASCTVRFEAAPPLFNPQGTLHGGVLATAMDVSMGHLLHHVAGAGATLEMKTQFLAPVTGGPVSCEGTFLRRGRKTSFLQSHAWRSDGTLAAHATATWRLLPSREDAG